LGRFNPDFLITRPLDLRRAMFLGAPRLRGTQERQKNLSHEDRGKEIKKVHTSPFSHNLSPWGRCFSALRADEGRRSVKKIVPTKIVGTR
jgi:hypothetical protein